MRPRPSLARRFLFVVIFLAAGSAILMAIALWQNPPGRCVERGGTWYWDGRYCEESDNDA